MKFSPEFQLIPKLEGKTMSDTKLRAKLPEGDANGLAGEVWRKKLVAQPLKPRVAIVIFDAPTGSVDHETGMEVPSARVLAWEPITDPLSADILVRQLQDSQQARTGQTTLDVEFPAPEPEKSGWDAPLEVEAPAPPHFEVRALPGGKFGLYLVSETGAALTKRGGLTSREYGEVALGATFFADDAPSEFRELVRVMLAEVAPDEDVVDAEVVEDGEPGDGVNGEPDWDEDDREFDGGAR